MKQARQGNGRFGHSTASTSSIVNQILKTSPQFPCWNCKEPYPADCNTNEIDGRICPNCNKPEIAF